MKIFSDITAVPPERRAEAARTLSDRCGYAAAALTLLPIPASELIAVMPLQVGMVSAIAKIYGVPLTRDAGGTFVLRLGATVGLSLLGSRLATLAAKTVLPVLGGLLRAPFMYATTRALGAVAAMYFARAGKLSDEELRDVYESEVRRARDEYVPSRARSQEAEELARQATAAHGEEANPVESSEDPATRLERLKELLERGLIEQEEYDAAKQRVLDAL